MEGRREGGREGRREGEREGGKEGGTTFCNRNSVYLAVSCSHVSTSPIIASHTQLYNIWYLLSITTSTGVNYISNIKRVKFHANQFSQE